MKISIYTLAKDAIRLDFHLKAMLAHHLQYADEIIVIECNSKDKTYQTITSFNNPKIRVFRENWNQTDSYLGILNRAQSYCTGDWCIKLDIDEFIPEWEWEKIRAYLTDTTADIVPIRLINFYGNYLVFHGDPLKSCWPLNKWPIHRNSKMFEAWGDSSNVRIKGHDVEEGRAEDIAGFEVHHFGAVRYATRLREKWRTQAIRNQRNTGMYTERSKIKILPSFLFNLFRHNWFDPAFMNYLKLYQGTVMNIVRQNPQEFVRDKMKLYNYLKQRENTAKTAA